ncbi:DsbA family protein [Stakelama pacifica]|uniref:Protein-disulfide isomerase n=1 Tax=Stakelama pacifica TaxID=517720 RepID=A0A4R6FJQ1_9SPHN|nr:DsbA family protein [Stakelama pacifica]TDN80775.1 protein-disulfide isomerase [Stakelama pacifica]GGO97186.1 DSBA oxidoreductase [Stakelama pacifica]
MTESQPLSRATLALLLILAAILGAGAMLLVQRLVPAMSTNRAAMEGVVHDYVMAHPELIPDAMDALRARQAAEAVNANRDAIVQPFASAWRGAKAPKANVVVYMDYACGFCRASLPEIDKLVNADPDVRVVYRELPVLSEESRTAALWSLAAAQQGRFQQFHDSLFAADGLTDQSIRQAAQKAGLDMAAAQKFAASDAAAAEIRKNLSVAGEIGVTGTPAWVIGDTVLSGAQSFAMLQDAVKKAEDTRS